MTYKTVEAAALKPSAGPHPAASPHDKGIGQALGGLVLIAVCAAQT